MPKTTTTEAEEIAIRIKEQYSQDQVNAIRGSISFGYDTKTTTSENILKTLKNAEDNMYKDKALGGESIRGNTINTIIRTLNEKSPREEQHAKRVSELCQNIGRRMGLSRTEVSNLKAAGLLHDIGKIAIDESILNKPGKLSEQELDEIKRHPQIGYRIFISSNELVGLADYILAHHEKWDGTGYPKGLKVEAIPREARIIVIADSYDAMISPRPYRNSISRDEALLEIKKNAGKQFDPDIARMFVENIGQIIGQVL